MRVTQKVSKELARYCNNVFKIMGDFADAVPWMFSFLQDKYGTRIAVAEYIGRLSFSNGSGHCFALVGSKN